MTAIDLVPGALTDDDVPLPEAAGGAGRWLDYLLPVAMGLMALAAWEGICRLGNVPAYLVPAPSAIVAALITGWDTLSAALLVTLRITAASLLAAVVSGAAVAIALSQSRLVERTFFPYAVILQVTPMVAIAPMIIIWVQDVPTALTICAAIIAFFPILSNTLVGLNSVDHNLDDLFQLYRTTRWQTLLHLKLPAAMPYFLAGLRISGGLALVGAVVAEFVAGAGGRGSGLAFRILESGYKLDFPRMFAALLLISLTGLAIYLAMMWLSNALLGRWHESAVKRDG